MITSISGTRSTVYWRGAADQAWAPVAAFDHFRESGIDPWYVDGDGQVYVLARGERDTKALYRFDPSKKMVEADPLVSLKGFDLVPTMIVDGPTKRLLGLHFLMERGGTHWFDKDLQQLQDTIDGALPEGRTNRLSCGRRCVGARFFVIESSSDRQPGEYYLFDRLEGKLLLVAAKRPWIKEGSQGSRSYHRVNARDGLSLPVYLTHPAGDKPGGQPLPLVVLVHGGPWIRGHSLRWDPEAQFLASRGYLVAEVEFRGSRGYGFAHFQASWKQWGKAMQDDLADVVAWTVK
jgi:dipeptidyl aminopeptidase/acylaminoacyl peptidase